ncbi:L-threonylcarbamoyladenylate synthase [Bombella apis]|uniref:L-threonylcarbamoyladenylate synthase n=1 Tax=Bombella apis TaxID=1785988 RepID=UPI0023F0A486|nr:L-threonylcarbamoyladenylate synthase [Bombella apis]MCT6819638.1 L-threonylcarbamoyladenylate synthase [Bombella apis]MCT6845399.1 L-threonylcarbamoyladenylate synthase [Bombella apis]
MPHTASSHHRTERLDQDHDGIRRAARLLRQGALVAFGTETVYGLGGLATSQRTVERIFKAKGRPSFNPLISHFASADAAFAEADMAIPLHDMARRLAQRFWPGPLTLILPRHAKSRIAQAVTAGLETLAVRVPKGRAVEDLLRLAGAPIAAPSANRSGRVSPSTARHVLDELEGRIDAVLDTGPCAVGLESTVLDLSGSHPILRRPGGVTLEELQEICGPIIVADHAGAADGTSPPNAPGQLSSHYAPSLPVRLDATHAQPDEAFLTFGDTQAETVSSSLTLNLSPDGNVEEAARRLFASLRQLDQSASRQGLAGIAVAPLPDAGLGRALKDRLKRAAAPRPTDSAAPPT